MSRRAEILAWLGARVGKPPGYERIVRRLLPIEKCGSLPDICLVRDGNLFITRPGLPLGWHVAFFGSYEPELRDIMRAVLPNAGVAIDVGANVGWHTLLMARQVGPQGRVIAIEPNPSTCEQLRQNVRLNKLRQVEIGPYAVADSERMVDFYGLSADDPGSASSHIVSDSTARTSRVNCRTLDAIASEHQLERIDLLKIDVEGFEWPVLQGGERTIANFRPYILFEFDSAYAGRGGGTPRQFEDFFRQHGYSLFSVGRNWAKRVEISTWPDCANIFAAPSDSVTPSS
jgi:FkbM family methyltransferase